MSRTPWLSVVMPVFNGGRHLPKAIDSVLERSTDDVEIVVSDDGSTDGSRGIVDAYSGRGLVVAIEGPQRETGWQIRT